MTLRLADKQVIVAEVAEVAEKSVTAVMAEYRGLTVAEMTSLRQEARNAGVFLKVVRNTLAKRALENTQFDCMRDALVGPLMLAFSEDPSAPARLIRDFAKSHDKLVVKHISIGGELLDASQLAAIAKLPNRDEAIAKLMGTMKAPITKFVQTLAAPHTKLVRTLAAVRDQKETG
ncbi:MAG: 50S ribosomal protein L10 [marine bacterium B5-7]|nr:MAG: 50S ribosomal protein L10 [marine bacterium B5-7]